MLFMSCTRALTSGTRPSRCARNSSFSTCIQLKGCARQQQREPLSLDKEADTRWATGQAAATLQQGVVTAAGHLSLSLLRNNRVWCHSQSTESGGAHRSVCLKLDQLYRDGGHLRKAQDQVQDILWT